MNFFICNYLRKIRGKRIYQICLFQFEFFKVFYYFYYVVCYNYFKEFFEFGEVIVFVEENVVFSLQNNFQVQGVDLVKGLEGFF